MEFQRFSDQDVLLTFQEAADLLRVSRATMYRLISKGELIGHKVGRGWRFYKHDIHNFVSCQKGTAMPLTKVAATTLLENRSVVGGE